MQKYAALLELWFGTFTAGFVDDTHRQRWFSADPQFDRLLSEQFADVLEAAAAQGQPPTFATPLECLAYVVLCDQLPRNIYRGTDAAFATDPLALNAARQGIVRGYDRQLCYDERCFFYMPFEHSESLLDQHTAVGLFMALRDETPKGHKQITGNYLRFAQQHRDIILRFGRFPHRNAVLGRSSTVEETEFVAPGDGFGQMLT